MKISSILGLNARTHLFAYKYNTKSGKNIADSKIQTARVLRNAGVAHPKIFKKFINPQDVFEFDPPASAMPKALRAGWNSLPDKFVLKPSRGMGGEGIIVIKKKLANGMYLTTNKERVTADDLKLHILDILEGAYSMGNVPDAAFVQEYVGRAKAFRRWAYRGTPDIRVIVFNKVPIMAMLRLPTKESGGRANLHQGALGLGVDIATGITTKAIWHGEQVIFKPGTERKLRGIKIPGWTAVLETAVAAQIASGLGYAGIDIVIHPEKGPMVLEINAQPGLQIQLANMEGLKKRLERVEDLDVANAEHGVNLAKALFAGRFENRRALEDGIKTIKNDEMIKIVIPGKHRVEVMAKIDTGAWRSSIDKTFAEENDLLNKDNILWTKVFKSSLGSEERPVINLSFYLAGTRIDTIASVANRKGLKKVVIIGRRDLQGFLVKVDDNAN
jgi:alpha-L-glutamate ligase-like protein